MCPPENLWLGWMAFSIKRTLLLVLSCVAYCLMCESVLALECCRSWGVTGVKAASPVWWLEVSKSTRRKHTPDFIFFENTKPFQLNEEKREAGGQGEFVADFNIFSYLGFFLGVNEKQPLLFFAPHALACRISCQCRWNFQCPSVLPRLSRPQNLTQIA